MVKKINVVRAGAQLARRAWVLAVFISLCGAAAGRAATNTILFTYANRAALLADGWDFNATVPGGAGRNTEITVGVSPPDVSYDQTGHPGVLRIPVDTGDLWSSANNTRNSIFRSLPTNWVSLRLQMLFAPTQNFQQSGMTLYQDDDNYVEANFGFNSGSVHVSLIREFGAAPTVVNGVTVTITNVYLRLDRELVNGDITGVYSLDGTNWLALGSLSHGLVNPRLGIWAGGSPGGFPSADLQRLDIVTTNLAVTTTLLAQPQALVFNSVAGQPCATIQRVRLVHRGPDALNWTVTSPANWITATPTNGPANGLQAGTCDISVNTAGLAAGTYQSTLNFAAPGAANTPATVNVTLIVNPATRARVATWQGARSGVLTVWVDNGYATAFDDLRTNGFAGTYDANGTNAPVFYNNYYANGMELAAHLFHENCFVMDEPTLRQEIVPNLASLCATVQPCPQAVSFAWPCGVTSPNEEAAAADYFLVARGYNLNTLEDATPGDFMNLKSFNSRQDVPGPGVPANPANFTTVVDAAIAQGKWANLVLQGNLDEDGAILYSVGRDIWVAPGGSVAKYILQRDRTVLTNYAENNGLIHFDFYRLPLSASTLRSFETAVTTNDVLTLQLDTSGIPGITGVTVNGATNTNYTTRIVGGKPTFLFNTPVTGTPQTVALSISTNNPPVLASNANVTLIEGQTFNRTETATDPDNNAVTFGLGAGAPAGLTLTAGGALSWVPGETNGGSAYPITVVATDNGVPPLSASNSFTITVLETNSPPVLTAITNVRVGVGNTLLITNTATDPDIPTNTLTFSLGAGAPAGLTLTTNGVLSWTPGVGNAASVYPVTVIVTDNGVPPMSDSKGFTVTVPAPNHAPVLSAQGDRVTNELSLLIVTNTATDQDIPADTLTYTFLVAPTNAVIDTNGVITWTPAEGQGPGTNTFTTVVTDNGVPPLSATNSFKVTVQEVNAAPTLPAQPNLVIVGPTPVVVTNTATDTDLPVNPLGYVLLTGPTNAVIDTNGVITWTPVAAQVPSTNLFTTVVTDTNLAALTAQHLSATNSFTVTVQTSPLVLPGQTNHTIQELTTLVVTNTATDTQITNGITGQLSTNIINFNYPDRASFVADGWDFIARTPAGQPRDTEITNPLQGGVVSYDQTNHPGTLQVPCDIGDLWYGANNSRNCMFHGLSPDWVSLQLIFSFSPNADYQQIHLGVYQDDDNYVEDGLGHNSSLDNGVPVVATGMIWELGLAPDHLVNFLSSFSNINFHSRLDRDPATGIISGYYMTNGVDWRFIVSHGQSLVNTRLLVWTGGATTQWTPGQTVASFTQVMVVVTNAPKHLTYQLLNPPAGAQIDTNGVITWTPTDPEAPSTNTITTVVTDNGVNPLNATNSFTVVVGGRPHISAMKLAGGSASFSWSTTPGLSYRVQYKNSLTNTAWTDLVPDVLATGPTAAYTNSVPGNATRFYRVRALP